MRSNHASSIAALVLIAGMASTHLHCTADEIIPTGEHDIFIFLSDVGSVGGGVSLENPIHNHFGEDDAGTLYIWVDTPDVIIGGVSLRVQSQVPGVISFDEPILYNPDIILSKMGDADTGEDRWDGWGVNDWFGYGKTDDLTGEFTAIGVFDNAGLDPSYDGSDPNGTLDPLFDVSAEAFLLGEVGYRTIGYGTTPIYLLIGDDGIINEGGHTSQVSVYFGAGEVVPSNALNAWSQRLIPSVLPDAIINVLPGLPGGGSGTVPEPSGLTLVALGLISLLAKRRRTWGTP